MIPSLTNTQDSIRRKRPRGPLRRDIVIDGALLVNKRVVFAELLEQLLDNLEVEHPRNVARCLSRIRLGVGVCSERKEQPDNLKYCVQVKDRISPPARSSPPSH